ncbi:sigma-70 family RNA polymerase sigma factor [Tellurirhabdus bombi]|uniref:sigma-70 family RNA polymerase sigma factor n=1 Tax=Tellurirhabdus bombi TaxID=2907205 RepID=UPI001F262DA2|nr:sigma-70 family RNA polymerase sigma factor [Tellurirhabdus bombi]
MTLEQTLLRQLHGENKAALQAIYERFAAQVYQFAFGYLKNAKVTEQVVRDVFSNLWEKRQTLSDTISLNGYLFTLTCHFVLVQFREQASEYPLQDVLQNLTTQTVPVNSEQVLYLELEEFYQQAIARLSKSHRQLYELSRHKGYSNQQIAEELSMSPHCVEESLKQAVAKISGHFAKYIN